MITRRAVALLIFLLALALYLPSVENGFAYDDQSVIRLNERLHDLGIAHRLFTQPYWAEAELGLYRPFTMFTFAVDWALVGDAPWWFHLVNALWNAGVCALLFLLLATWVPIGAAALGTIVFAAHPVHVEAVANVVGRAELIAAFFSLAALLLWIRTEPDARHPPLRLAMVTLCFLLAVLSKESAIMLPALFALTDAARGLLTPRTFRAWLERHAPAVVALGAVTALYLGARGYILGAMGPAVVDPALDVARSTGTRIMTGLQMWPHVARLFLYPRTLLSDYGPRIIMPALTPTLPVLLGAAIFLGLLGGGLYAWARGRGRLAFLLLFLPVTLLPVSNLLLPIGVIVAERALYLPSIVLAAALAFGAHQFWTMRTPRYAIGAAALVVTTLFTIRTVQRIPVWESTSTVFDALRTDRPDSFRAMWHHARVAADRKDARTALDRYAQALNLWPHRQRLVIEAATYAVHVGDIEFGKRLSDYAIGRWPPDLGTVRLRAGIALDQADTTTALRLIEQGLRLEPEDSLLGAMRAAALTKESP